MKRRKFLKGVGAGISGVGLFAGGYQSRDVIKSQSVESSKSIGTTSRVNEIQSDAEAETPVEDAYYVSPDGDDSNSGSKGQPFATLETAVNEVSGGGTIYLRGGIYRRKKGVQITDVEGNSDARITVAGYPGERPVYRFDGPLPGGWDVEGGIDLSNVHYLTIRNLVVRNSPNAGIGANRSTNNRFENIISFNNNIAGIGLYDNSSNNVLQNIAAANNYDRQTNGNNADGVQLSHTKNNTVRNGRFCFNADDGLDLWGSRSITVKDCLSWSNGRGDSDGGNGFKLGGDEESGGHYVARNVAYHNRYGGFMYNTATLPMEVYNNTAWANSYNFSFYGVNHRLANNIGQDGQTALGPLVKEERNTWNLRIDDAEFASYHPDTSNFLHLSENSPCINAGTDVGLSYSGKAPDLGAYENSSAS